MYSTSYFALDYQCGIFYDGMTRKKKIIVALLLILSGSSIAVFVYLKLNPGLFNREYAEQAKICPLELDEKECLNRDDCELYYEPCKGVSCYTEVLQMPSGCRPSGLSGSEIRLLKAECKKQGGKFRKDRHGYQCRCGDSNACLFELTKRLRSN